MTHNNFVVHADGANDDEDAEGERADDSGVVDAVVDDLVALGAQQRVERVAEADRVHRGGHRVGERENHSDRGAELGPQRSRYDVVDST